MLRLKCTIYILVMALVFEACEKEYSYEGGALSGTAVFTPIGGTGQCINAQINGVYQEAAALDASNTVLINVDVAQAGTYTISTAIVNGISFGASGTFTTTGSQTILLSGSGTPVSDGTFTFNAGPNGCLFSVIVAPASGGTGGPAVFTFNGAPGNCLNFTPGGIFTQGTALTSANYATLGVNVTTVGTYNISTGIVNGISFSRAGTFTNTGVQTVLLTGSGTPVAAGVFNFSPGASACTFSVTVNAATITNCKECSYVPTCQGSRYTYVDTINGIAAVVREDYIQVKDTFINVKNYSKVVISSTAGNDTNYIHCNNGTTSILAFNVIGLGGFPLPSFESTLLKASDPQGTNWIDLIPNGIGQNVEFNYTMVEKGISRTLLGNTFPDVIHVYMTQGMILPFVGFTILQENDFYYARGVGLIEYRSVDPATGTTLTHRVLQSYFIP